MKHLKKGLKSSDGQVAIILILVIAAALIFYAVSLNLGQFTISRVLVTIASNTSASMLASDMASYGQALSESSLGGEKRICAWTGIMAAMITIVIIVIAIVIGIFSSGSASTPFLSTTAGFLAVVGLVLAVVALAIQLTVIQPGLTEAWNEIIGATLSMQNQFTEGAIQSAMGKVVTDGVNVPDVTDQDRDRLWVPATALGTLPFADTISRYGIYYTERLRQIKDQVVLVDIAQFIMALEELLYDGTDGWGLYDPMPNSLCLGRAECHPCCVPDTATIDGTPMTGLRSTNCTAPLSTDDAGWAQLCEPASPYQIGPMGDGGVGEGYPWLFDSYFENPFNIFRSFREEIGIDDEHQDFYKDSTDPNSLPAPRASQFAHAIGNEGFRLEDATGFYTDPNPIRTDAFYTGIFPYFYKMADWGVDLANVQANIAADPTSRECHWCDDRDLVNCFTCGGYPPHPQPGEIPQLVLPLDPAIPADGLIYNTTYFVDEVRNTVDVANALPQPFPPLAVDRVEFPVPGNIIADDDALTAVCAQSTLYPQPPSQDGFWRRGGDRFCRDEAPYFMECPKCMGIPDCECGIGTDPFDFPEDGIDDIIYSLPDFYEWAQRIIAAASDMASFSDDFPNWYSEAAVWIEPMVPPGAACYVCNLILPDGTPVPEGILWIWLKEITEMRDRLIQWINNYNIVTDIEEGYPGMTCTEVWCVPDSTLVCPEIPAGEGEDATFDANLNGLQGDVVDIISCLNYNVEGYDHVAAEAFKDCLNNCGIADCTVGAGGTLPAFHLDGATPYDYPPTVLDCIFVPWAPGNDWFDAMTANIASAVKPPATLRGNDYRFRKCAMSCSLADCHRLPRSMVPFSRGPIYWPA
ncbi:MAG: hypothetical protein KAR31_05240, partial [Candidatus Omnitrophica bacterium]|nr:hypothetical protein [Candidatus Omnitrophota bacterium]